jgi:class 3 adenylate cyclase/pimeloyl-ACP methyl ester carboxylesterase
MQPQVQYRKTSDGVSIACVEKGQGMPLLVQAPQGFVTASALIDLTPFWRALAASFHVVIFDGRGFGQSDRDVDDFSADVQALDFTAAAKCFGEEKLALFAAGDSVPPAITYAVSQPDRVSHLVLINGWTWVEDWRETPMSRAGEAMREQDWELYTETFARVFHGLEGDAAKAFAASMRAAATPKSWNGLQNAAIITDVRKALPNVRAKTLIVNNRRDPLLVPEAGQRMAAAIPNSRLALIDDRLLQHRSTCALIEEFVLGRVAADARPRRSLPSGTAIILFADIVDSTALTERLGDDAFREKARGLDEAMRTAIRGNGGSPIEGKTLGDGVLAVFTSAKQAIACAQACHHAADAAGLSLHAGIHAGDVIREADPDGRGNVYGGAVNIAARVAAASAPGETLVSGTVRDLARTSAGVTFEDRGEQALKGIDDPVRVFAVRPA